MSSNRVSPALFSFPMVDPRTGFPTPMFAQAWQSLVNQAGDAVFAVASLPAASGASGQRAFVTDSTVSGAGNFGAAVAGGGSHMVPVYCDGTAWRIG